MEQYIYYVYVNTYAKSYWRAFDNKITAMLFAKINGYKLIAKGKEAYYV